MIEALKQNISLLVSYHKNELKGKKDRQFCGSAYLLT